MENNYNIISHLKAITAKLKTVKAKDKVKLILKVIFRVFGIKKNLLLGGYYIEECLRQEEDDQEIYKRLTKQREILSDLSRSANIVSDKVQSESYHIDEKIEAGFRKNDSYIALVCQSLDNGGLEEVVGILATELRKRKISVKIFCIESGGAIAQKLQDQGFDIVIFKGNIERLKKYCEENRPILVNTHYATKGLEAFSKLNIPIVEVIHNMYLFLDEKAWKREKEKSNYICEYIAVSESAKKMFCNRMTFVPEEKITVVGNTWNYTKQITKSCEEVRNEWRIPLNAFVFIMVGSIDSRKNQLGVLRAWDVFRKLKDGTCMLLIVGSSTDFEYEASIKKIIKRKKLEKDIIFTGQNEEIYNLLNASDVFIMNSYYEGWSVSSTEAIFCGVPIIHSDCGSGRELTAGEKNGLLVGNPLSNIEMYSNEELYYAMHAGKSENIEELVQAMLKMYDSREQWKGKRENISAYAEENFNVNHMINSYLEVFARAIQ